MPKTIMSYGKFFDQDYFGGTLRLTFVYVTKFSYRHLDWVMESAVRNLQPYALVFNTGAWDFDAGITYLHLKCALGVLTFTGASE